MLEPIKKVRMQNGQNTSFFSRNWLTFLYPPIPVQMEDTPPRLEMDEESDAKLPGLPTFLWLYQKRSIDAGMTVTFSGLLITTYLSWVWPFLIGLAINGVFIMILLRYRSRFHLQHPIIARQCTRNAVWLVFLEVFTIMAFLIWIFGERQVVHF